MSSKSKTGLIGTLVISLVLIVLLNIVTWVIPFNKINNDVFLATYICTTVMIVFSGVFVAIEFFTDKALKHVVLGIPLLTTTIVAVVLQLLACVGFYLANSFVPVESWILIVVEVVIFAYFVATMALGFFFKNRIIASEENNHKTATMEKIRDDLLLVTKLNQNSNISADLEELFELVRYSDKVSSAHTQDIEAKIVVSVAKLKEEISTLKEEEIKSEITNIINLVNERNIICKANK